MSLQWTRPCSHVVLLCYEDLKPCGPDLADPLSPHIPQQGVSLHREKLVWGSSGRDIVFSLDSPSPSFKGQDIFLVPHNKKLYIVMLL